MIDGGGDAALVEEHVDERALVGEVSVDRLERHQLLEAASVT